QSKPDRRNPPELDPAVRRLLNLRSAYYNKLSAEQKTRFRERLALFAMATDFKPQAMDNVPEDVKAVVAYYGVMLTLPLDDFLLPPFENVAIYKGPFPSPQLEQWHISETFAED
ncbi:zinc-dependent peptidase, partial [Arthrospira platensis SPKY1]|nr:zinc-dependent peptidase [Arthrospira platensis SPKY1]